MHKTYGVRKIWTGSGSRSGVDRISNCDQAKSIRQERSSKVDPMKEVGSGENVAILGIGDPIGIVATIGIAAAIGIGEPSGSVATTGVLQRCPHWILQR